MPARTRRDLNRRRLRLLREAGLVTACKDGKLVYYALHQDNVAECCGMLISKFVAMAPVQLIMA